MKNIIMIRSPLGTVLLSIAAILILTQSCNEFPADDKNEGENFQENLNSFTNTIDRVDSTLDLMDQLQREIEKIEEDRNAGNISDDEAIRRLDDINEKLGRKIAKQANTSPATVLPRWAKRLGLTEPEGLAFDQDFSQSTSDRNPSEGFNSVIMVYRGEYNMAMKQAEIIAKKADIPLSQDYKDALMLKKEYGIETIKGASYMNFEIGADDNPKYTISITVDDDGTLTINATDNDAFLKQIEEN